MDDHVEPAAAEHPEIVHRGPHQFEVEPPLTGDVPVEGEHGGGQVDDRHPCPRCRVERAVLAATGREAEHLEADEALRQPRPVSRRAARQPPPRIIERVIGRRPREGHPAGGEPIPRAGVVCEDRIAGRDPFRRRSHA